MKAYTVNELIIEVQQQVQRGGSHRRDETSPDRIIWRLNTAQELLIRSKIKPSPNNPEKFMIDEANRQAIQGLISTVRLPMYKDSSKRAYTFLPESFRYLINDRSIVLEDCKEEFQEPITDSTLWITALKFTSSSVTSAPYYRTVIARKTENGSPSSDQTINYNLKHNKEKFEIVEDIMRLFKLHNPYGVYWERFNDFFFPESFVVVWETTGTGNQVVPNFDLFIDGQEATKVTRTLSLNKFKAYDGEEAPNRSYQNDVLYDAVTHSYYEEPTPESPVSQLANNKIFVFNHKRFLVPEIIIDYIRKPRRISLYLNQTSELDGSVHFELCSRAAELILSNIEASNYPTKVQENINRTE